jgi:cardiolipin synthase (CMP-forming)
VTAVPERTGKRLEPPDPGLPHLGQPDPEPDLSRILTVPNVISLVRLACIPVFLWLLFERDNRAAAAWLLGALGATDWVDGYIARHYRQVSTLGKVLDPLADRLLLVVGVVAILVDGSVPAWVAWLAIAREVAVSVGVIVLATLGARRIDVTWVGKAGTFALMFAFPLFLGGESTLSYHELAHALAWVAAIPGLVLGYYAALTYIPLGRRALADGRAARHAATA